MIDCSILDINSEAGQQVLLYLATASSEQDGYKDVFPTEPKEEFITSFYNNGNIQSHERFWGYKKCGISHYYYHDNKNIALKMNYVQGIPSGSFVFYHKNQQPMLTGAFSSGLYEGIYHQYDETGYLITQMTASELRGKIKNAYDSFVCLPARYANFDNQLKLYQSLNQLQQALRIYQDFIFAVIESKPTGFIDYNDLITIGQDMLDFELKSILEDILLELNTLRENTTIDDDFYFGELLKGFNHLIKYFKKILKEKLNIKHRIGYIE